MGIPDCETLLSAGALEAYRRLKWRFPREINVVALYALEGALTGTHWTRLPDIRKEELRRFARQCADHVRCGSRSE